MLGLIGIVSCIRFNKYNNMSEVTIVDKNESLRLRNINDLLKERFYIPSYQRGYRWDKAQIEDLLEDIWEFSRIGGKQEGEFYCLQPIIVKNESNKYLLIDGQQRLTTIYILLSYFDDIGNMLYGMK